MTANERNEQNTYCCAERHANMPGSIWCNQCESLVAGTIIDDYTIVSYVGQGSSSVIYLAKQRSLNNRKVVIKLLQQSGIQPDIASFRREAALLASLSHPYILPIYAYGAIEDQQEQARPAQPYLVLPYAEQGSMEDIFVQEGKRPWSLQRVASLSKEVAEALDYAHSRGVLHRDVKPANLLQKGSHVLLSDFSVASLISPESSHLNAPWAGSPAYMAPEVWDHSPGRYSDQYALAVTCFRLLAGDYPWETVSTGSGRYWVQIHHHTPPRSLQALRADVPSEVDFVLQRALAKDPHERYPTVHAFAADLLAAIQETTQVNYAVDSMAIGAGNVGEGLAAALAPLPGSGHQGYPQEASLPNERSYNQPRVVAADHDSNRFVPDTPAQLRPALLDVHTDGKELLRHKHTVGAGLPPSLGLRVNKETMDTESAHIVEVELVPTQPTPALAKPAQVTSAPETPALSISSWEEDDPPGSDGWIWGALLLNLLICILLAVLNFLQNSTLAAAANILASLWPSLLIGPILALTFQRIRLESRAWALFWGVFFGIVDVLLCALICYAWTALALTIPQWGYNWQYSGDGLRIFLIEIAKLAPTALQLILPSSWLAVLGGACIGIFSMRTEAEH